MKHLSFTIKLYVLLLLLFILQKPIFMAYNHKYADHLQAGDYLDVMRGGLSLDLSISAYLTVIPLLVALLALFIGRFDLKKWLTPYYITISTVMAVLFVCDTVIYSFLGVKIDALELMYLSNPADMMASLTFSQAFAGIASVTLLAAIYTLLMRWITPRAINHQHKIIQLIAVIPMLGFLFLAVRGGVSKSTANVSYAYFSPVQFLNHSAVNPVFNMFHSIGKYEDINGQFRFYPDEQVGREWQTAFSTDTTTTARLLRTDRPDILLIIWEGCGSHYADDSLITPGFNRLKQEGTYFSRMYANSYRTDRGLVSLISGWQSLPTMSLMKRTDICRRLPSISNDLNHAGYTSNLYYGGDIDFTNMRCYFTEAGFTTIMSDENIKSDAPTNPWGYHDEWYSTLLTFPKEATERQGHSLPEETKGSQFTVFLTLSSHEPWTVPYQRLSDKRENAFAYTDSCISVLIDGLRQTRQWDNLLVIITADHGINWYDGQPASDTDIPHIPMLWLGGALNPDAPHDIGTILCQSDLAMTLLAQLHITPQNPYPLSRNIFSSRYTYPFAFNASKGGIHLIDSAGASTYDHTADRETSETFRNDTTRTNRTRSLLQYIYKVTADLK